jgi:hypothetical protein
MLATLNPFEMTPMVDDSAQQIVYLDTFDDNASRAWSSYAGWSSANGGLQTQMPSLAFPLAGKATHVSAEARVEVVAGNFRLQVRRSGSDAYTADLLSAGYLSLFRNGVLVQWVQIPQLNPGEYHLLRLSAEDARVRVALDGIDLLDWYDPAPLPAGSVTLASAFPGNNPASVLRVDSLVVTTRGSERLAVQPATSAPAPEAVSADARDFSSMPAPFGMIQRFEIEDGSVNGANIALLLGYDPADGNTAGKFWRDASDGASAGYVRVDMGSGLTRLRLRAAAPYPVSIHLRTGWAGGAVVCTLNWQPSGTEWSNAAWQTQESACSSAVSGRQMLYLTVSGGINVNWFEIETAGGGFMAQSLSGGSSTLRLEMESANILNNLPVYSSWDPQGGGQVTSALQHTSYARFDNINLGSGLLAFRMRGVTEFAVTIHLRVGGENGTPMCSLTWTPNASWDDWQTRQTSCTPTGGVQTLFVTFTYPGGTNFAGNWIEIDFTTVPQPTPTPTATPGGAATLRLKAESAQVLSGLTKQPSWDPPYIGDVAIGALNSSYARFDNVNLGSGLVKLRVRGVTEFPTTLYLRAGSPTGTILCSLNWTPSANWDFWYTQEMSCAGGTSGVQTLFVTFAFPGGQNFAINWIELDTGGSQPPTVTPQPTATPGMSNTYRFQIEDGDQRFGAVLFSSPPAVTLGIQRNNWIAFQNIDLGDGLTGFKMRASGNTFLVEIRLGSPTGHIACSFTVQFPSWGNEQSTACDGSTGVHTLYVNFPSSQTSFTAFVDWIELRFATGGTTALSRFGITTTGDWSEGELRELQLAVEQTAQAFFIQYNDSVSAQQTSPLAMFKRVFFTSGNGYNQIEFHMNLDAINDTYCTTDKLPSTQVLGRVRCYRSSSGTFRFNQYTLVHELGHVFVGRTGGTVAGSQTYFGLIQSAVENDRSATGRRLVFGVGRDILNRTDWIRGERGWGSGASLPGRCDGSFQPNANALDFQQNPCQVIDTDYPGLLIVEREEAAADMFLNWVYNAFANISYEDICNPSGCPDTPANPGTVRRDWMSNTMNALRSVYGW